MDQLSAAETNASPAVRRARWRRWALRVGVGLLLVIAAIWLVLFVTKGRFLRHPFESVVGKLTHRTVTVGGDFQLYFAPWRIKFVAERIATPIPIGPAAPICSPPTGSIRGSRRCRCCSASGASPGWN